MGTHWVKAKTLVRSTDEAGNVITYQPGDWLPVRNQQLKMLLANGQIEVQPKVYHEALGLSDCGIVVTGGNVDTARAHIAKVSRDVLVQVGEPQLIASRTLLWDANVPLRLDLLPVGFDRLRKGWQLAVPLFSYTILARDIGSEDDRQRTLKIIRDLRVPVYDTRMAYIQRCSDTERLMEAWKQERGGDDKLAFLRALYRTTPIICALPTSWVSSGG